VDDDELSIASEYSVGTIPRAREVGQGWIHSFFTTVRAAVHAAAVVFRERPHVLLCNGPGTCVPVVAWAFVARTLRPVTWFVGVGSRPAIVYVESAARTKTMSLTGRILYTTRLADEVFVQWEGLARRYPRAKFAGRVC
jgi:beta-1,4-N-acetylglucosaminyltransferase